MHDYLIHYGILGQKWGIRRYQNPDGSLTPAGRRRLKNKDTFQETEEEMKTRLLERPTPKEVYENMDKFTTKELTQMYNRMNVESNIRNLVRQADTKDSTYRNIMKELEQANKDIDTMNNTITKLAGGKKKRQELDEKMTEFLASSLYAMAVTNKD